MNEGIKLSPQEIFEEYKRGVDYKSSIGDKGIYEQTKINERFYVGDQWYGVGAGNSRPLVRRNIIKRIGEYKMSAVGASPIAVRFSADGVPDTVALNSGKEMLQGDILNGKDPFAVGDITKVPDSLETSVIMSAMSNYFSATAERLGFDNLCEQALRNAYISGTGFIYTYWNPEVETGLYADGFKSYKIKGDISAEVLDVENVNLGDPNNYDLQTQPFIIISQRKNLGAVLREAALHRGKNSKIVADSSAGYNVNSGDRGEREPGDSERVTVLTKLWKQYCDDGSYRIMGIKVTENSVVRAPWDLRIKSYPLAKFCWERRRSCAYGDSEITYLIPNQIAINRALTAAVWATMNAGMPKVLINGDAVQDSISNDPGQIICVNSGENDVIGAVRYLEPPSFAEQFEKLVNDISVNTMSDSGANDAALGNVRPDNASAIIQVREAALQPIKPYQNRYYSFIEEIARIWSDFWIHMYGDRQLKVCDNLGVYYVPFHAERYKNLVINAKVDVGASALWSESVVISTLENMLKNGVITVKQYLERMPKGIVPNLNGVLSDIENNPIKEKNDDSQQNNQ